VNRFIHMQRERSGKEHTYGTFSFVKTQGDTLEDEYRAVKVDGETRICRGTYEILLRDAGKMNKSYHDRYPFHRGMLWLQNVPKFEWIYIHPGTTDLDTLGCILVGSGRGEHNGRPAIWNSRITYEKLYKECLEYFDAGDRLYITIKD
jgi:hypothetical protein